MPNEMDTIQSVSEGGEPEIAYAIGDVHGCYDKLIELLGLIEADCTKFPDMKKKIIFLGDLIDRGPKSAEIIEFLSTYNPEFADVVFLMGNHEEVFLKVLEGSQRSLAAWFEFGGRECVRSYGMINLSRIHSDPENLLAEIQIRVPEEHHKFISRFENYHITGKYLCVHAGIRPKIPLKKQTSKDMRWIREKFLSYEKPHPYVVVHGHTVSAEPEILSNRIGIDTGAHKNGPLTAVRLSGDYISILQTTS